MLRTGSIAATRAIRRLSSRNHLHRPAPPSLFNYSFLDRNHSSAILCNHTALGSSKSLAFYTTGAAVSTTVENAVSEGSSVSLEAVSELPPVSGGYGDAYAAIELALDSVVKIFTVSSSPNYTLPWQNKPQRESMGSGFVISGRRILTNAHVVADHTFVMVRKHGSPTKYKAEVVAVGHDCDLAILKVEQEEFWEGMNALELGEVPFLQEAVAVVGYPQDR